MHKFETAIKTMGIILALALLSGCLALKSDRDLLIVPLGEVSPTVLDSINEALYAVYKVVITTNAAIDLPDNAIVKIKTTRYRADSLLVFLEEIRKKEGYDYVMGITEVDISTTKRIKDGSIKEPVSTYIDWGIFGLGYRPGRASVISTYRLQQNSPHYYARIKKVAVHEFGHNLGLPHCVDTDTCVMRDAAERLQTIDMVGDELCYVCKKKLNM